ncbi:threonine synthase [Haladaptatus salinisoli]|uniref:threonine synthase n=1 Tax=Haladaptatus salinisoli TaxID=2884876 RepID=UPI001D09A941|nr:threonine synthase [Haladaptatus salinisoli]
MDGDFRAALPSFDAEITAGEGETPLVDLAVGQDDRRIGSNVTAKLESLNPTCSFKDRGSALAVSAIRSSETSFEAVVVASTGNTATSVAAYAARADIPCAILVPAGPSSAKLAQAAAHDPTIFTVDGTFSDCFDLSQRVADERVLNATAVYSANAFVASANRTVAFELVHRLGKTPDWVSVPVGAGPLLGGVYLGFRELRDAGITGSVPRMLCVQAMGCHPIVRAVEDETPVTSWDRPIRTNIGAIADPLRGYAEDGEHTRQAILASSGTAVALDDATIKSWQKTLASEGIYAESASAASVAAIAHCDAVAEDHSAVALVTGHGLKEPSSNEVPTKDIDTDIDTVRDALLN